MLKERYLKLLKVLAAAMLALAFSGCSTTQSTRQITVERIPPLPPSLLRECPEYRAATSSGIDALLEVYVDNMEAAGKCRARHNALVDLLNSIIKKETR